MYAPFGYKMSIFTTTFTCAKLKRKGRFWYNLYQAWRTLEGGPNKVDNLRAETANTTVSTKRYPNLPHQWRKDRMHITPATSLDTLRNPRKG
ncbi:uncharacterized protein VTP21DRAFT_5828 [Calcarisporiella thermophila]|uniref:uncharacterized protein n=1 Tax=Calcarisporiella thermophila TaxID=911321 RepID=UPI0037442876